LIRFPKATKNLHSIHLVFNFIGETISGTGKAGISAAFKKIQYSFTF